MLEVRVDDRGDVVLVETSQPSEVVVGDGSEQARSAYRVEKQRELTAALTSRVDDVREMQAALQEKAAARIRAYREQQ